MMVGRLAARGPTCHDQVSVSQIGSDKVKVTVCRCRWECASVKGWVYYYYFLFISFFSVLLTLLPLCAAIYGEI